MASLTDLRLMVPWRDASGRFSVLKATTLIALFVPAIWMLDEVWSGRWDFPSPYVLLIYHSGLWTTYLLLLGLLITPARKVLRINRLIQLRRMIGIASFSYMLLHISAWLGLRFWDGGTLLKELLQRPSLWIATLAAIGLVPLTATSFNAAIRCLGTMRWNRLHSSVYGLTGMAVIHFLMSPGSLQGLPFLMAGCYFWLMAWRVLDRKGLGTDAAPLVGLAVASSLITLLLQPFWLATVQAEIAYYTPWQAFALNFTDRDWDVLGVPPVWQVLGAGLLVALLAWVRRAFGSGGLRL